MTKLHGVLWCFWLVVFWSNNQSCTASSSALVSSLRHFLSEGRIASEHILLDWRLWTKTILQFFLGVLEICLKVYVERFKNKFATLFLMSLGRSWVVSEALKIHSKALSRTCDDFKLFIIELYKYVLVTWIIVNIQFLLNELHSFLVVLVGRIYFLSRQFLFFANYYVLILLWEVSLWSQELRDDVSHSDVWSIFSHSSVSYWYHISKTYAVLS